MKKQSEFRTTRAWIDKAGHTHTEPKPEKQPTTVLCWNDIDWLRDYVQYIQENHSYADPHATDYADKQRERRNR